MPKVNCNYHFEPQDRGDIIVAIKDEDSEKP
jgi:hypothetical protein